jgi:hypothetical protein
MIVQNLEFFDKFGKNLNLQYNVTTNIWEGTIYFEGISIYLFDNENLFILEKVGTNYKFPTLTPTQSLDFSWESNKNSEVFFFYDVEKDLVLDEQFINRVESKEIKYTDYIPTGGSAPLDIRVPLQVNIGFSPTDEIKFERVLHIYRKDTTGGGTRVKIATLSFYGEGIEEDERFGVWASNFGIKFLKEDANILKDYDIKEAYPDYKQLNQARKELLVNKEQIYPYIGTYKGLSNFINILGYRDVLQIKEYWKNINRRSSYRDKLIMVDISDYLDDGIIDTLDLTDKNRNIKEGKQFIKTEFLALVYQFTRATDDYDDDGVPIVEETTEFTVNEIFYKLNRLNEKVKNEFLPVNVKVKDIIGEFIYFQKITLKYWSDDTRIFDYSINDPIQLEVFPGDNVNLTLRSLEPLYRRSYESGIDFGIARINNNSSKNPFEIGQKYSRSENLSFIENITEFYTQIRSQRFPDLGKKLTWEFGDDPQRVIGAPIIITINPNRFTVNDLRGVKLEDLDQIAPGLDPYWTLENIDFRNYYETNWRITKTGPNPYYFEYRGKTVDVYQLAHVLPYAGKYRITVELIDFYGNTSVFSRFITVQSDMKPEIVAFTRLEDKFNYYISNLSNVQLQDFGASPLYYPKVNVLNNEDAVVKIDIYKNLLEWISFFKNRYGMGQNLYDVELYDDNTSKYVKYFDPAQNHPKKTYWGLGEDDLPISLKDYDDITIGELYWMRLTDFVYLDDFEAGFYIRNPRPGSSIKISLFSEYIIPQFSTLEELTQILNNSNHPGIKLFNYEIIDGKKSDNQYIIHAQAEYLSKEMYHMLTFGGGFSPSPSPLPAASPSPGGKGVTRGDEYTFFLPRKVFSHQLINYLKQLSPVFDDETMFLLSKTSDIISGAAQDPSFWVDKKYWKFVNDQQIGYLPTTIDQNAFNINDIKLFEETCAVPENAIMFFVINNLDGKNEFIWTLTNDVTGEEIKAKSVPFFVWKFKDLGNFTLTVDVIDNRNTTYTSKVQNFIRVLDKRRYTGEVEDKLNARKLRLLKSRA